MDRGAPLRHDPIGQAEAHWRAHGWSDATPGMAFVTSVIRVQQLLLAEVDRVLKPRGLTFARYEVLMLLRFSRRGSMPVGKVGERLQVHPASVTNAVDRLERDGLVRRVRHPEDGRSVLVELTSAGADLAADATDALNAEVFGALPIGPDVTTGVTALLRDVRRSFGDFT